MDGPSVELMRVLVEADELELAMDWAGEELVILYNDAARALADPDANYEERMFFLRVRAVLGPALRELREIESE